MGLGTPWISGLVFLLVGCAGSGGGYTATAVEEKVKAKGAASTVQSLRSNDGEGWSVMLTGIESGDAQWLKIGGELRPATDASASTELDFAVARALPKSPAEVLGLVKTGKFRIADVCTVPYIEPDDPTVVQRHIEASIEALESIQVQNLEDVRDRCLTRMTSFRGQST